MSTPAILLIGLTLATCVIAFWADNLGKKLGKKRISLFGLRPRQTATLISVISSVGIMLLTVAALLVTSARVREALLRFDALKASNLLHQQEAQHLTRRNADLRRAAAGLRTEQTVLLADVGTARRKAAQAHAQAAAALAEVTSARHSLALAQERLQAAQAARLVALRGQAAADKAARVIEGNLREARLHLQGVRNVLAVERQDLLLTRQELRTARHNLILSRNAAETANRANARTLHDLQQKIQEVTSLELQYATQKQRVNELTARETDLEKSIAGLKAQLVPLQGLTVGKVMVDAGAVLAEKTVPAGCTAEEVTRLLNVLMQDGQRAAHDLGAPALKLEVVKVTVEKHEVVLEEPEILDLMAKHLAGSELVTSLRLIAARHHAQGEPVLEARVIPVEVRRAFARGDLLASATIDGSQTDARIFNQLLGLLSAGEGIARENEHGVRPVLTALAPNLYANGTNERIFEALRQIQAVHNPVLVKLVASDDISTVEHLQVKFEVKSS